ncbi:Vegetative incompatibility protein HET-E-1 [Colletotrichum fructicola]|nr:Vegetative incompatibility protein HET-E-1 [Colletotrichum fructicola]KAF4936760.1 Vegetative incompatibility protein HET-E-1 [Colletotrichum fructicola]
MPSQLGESPVLTDLEIIRKISDFFRSKFLYWMEALIRLGHVSEGIQAIQKLGTLIEPQGGEEVEALPDFIRDANRFVLYNRAVTEGYPSQLYTSSLVFCPEDSIVRKHFKHDIPSWITTLSGLNPTWDSCLQTLQHDGEVFSISFSRDGRWLASACEDGVVRLWDAATGILVRKLPEIFESPTSLAFSGRIGKSAKLAIGHGERIAEVWDPETGTHLLSLYFEAEIGISASDKEVYSLDFSFDDRQIVSLDGGGKVFIWDAETGAQNHTLPSQTKSRYKRLTVFSPDGLMLATVSDEETINIWQLRATHSPQTLGYSDGVVDSITFSADSRLLASANDNIYVWDVITGSLIKKIMLDRADISKEVSFPPQNGSRLLAWSVLSEINICDLGKPASNPASTWKLGTHGSDCFITSLSFSPDGQRIASATDYGEVKVWDVSSHPGKSIHTRSQSINDQLVSSQDGSQSVFYAANVNAVGIWSVETGWQESLVSLEKEQFSSLAFSNDGDKFACVTSSKIMIFKASSGSLLQTIPNNNEGRSSVAFRNAREIASVSSDAIKIWDIDTRECTKTFKNHSSEVLCLAFSADGQWLVRACHKRKGRLSTAIKVWDLRAGGRERTLYTEYEEFRQVMFSPDNLMILLNSPTRIGVWDLGQNSRLWTLSTEMRLHVSFDANLSTRLHTQFGFFDLHSVSPNNSDRPVHLEEISFSGYGIGLKPDDSRNWIMRDGERLVCIPSDFHFNDHQPVVTPFINGTTLIWASSSYNQLLRLELSEP